MAGLVLAMLIWGSSFIIFKMVLSVYSPLFVVAARMFVACIMFLIIWKYWANFNYCTGDWKFLLIMAMCEPCLYFLFEAWALKFTTASEAGVMTSMLPLMVAILAGLVLSEKISLFYWIGLVVTVPGVIWLSVSGVSTDTAPNPTLGNFLELCAMVVAAVYTVALRFLASRYSALFLTAVQAFCGLIFFVPLVLIFEFNPIEWHGQSMLFIFYLGSVVTLGGYGLYNYGVKVLSASEATIFTNFIPIFTLMLAYIVLGERILFEQFLAILLIFCGVIISQIKGKAPAIPVETF